MNYLLLAASFALLFFAVLLVRHFVQLGRDTKPADKIDPGPGTVTMLHEDYVRLKSPAPAQSDILAQAYATLDAVVNAAERRHVESMAATIAAGIACQFGGDNLKPEEIADKALFVLTNLRNRIRVNGLAHPDTSAPPQVAPHYAFSVGEPVSLLRYHGKRDAENHGWFVAEQMPDGSYTLMHPYGGKTNARECEMQRTGV